MKRIVPFALLLCLAAPAFAGERRYTVTDFDRIVVEGPYEVVLKTGKAPSARATGSEEALDRVSIEVQGRTLKVRANRSAWGGYPGEQKGSAAIELSTHGLRGATVTGSGGLDIDKAKAMRFDLALAGSGRISLGAVDADNLVVSLVGAGSVKLAGKVKSLRLSVQGSGGLDGSGLVAEDARIIAETSGTIELNVKRIANISAAGSGDTMIVGTPACTVTALGSGRVLCGKD